MKIVAIAGNGLSMSMLSAFPSPNVDLSNLFAKGGDVSWPATGLPSFLSYEYCPNLWSLGARPGGTAERCYEIIEEVITAVNACCLSDPSKIEDGVYVRAYKELVAYLRYLFVHYDKKLVEEDFFGHDGVYGPLRWILKGSSSAAVERIDVISFNYDAMLERCLMAKGIEFAVPLLSEKISAKVRIHKPHGSITFCGKKPLDKSAFELSHGKGFSFGEGEIENLEVRYEGLDEHYAVMGILPPAGESERYPHRWIRQIWNQATAAAEALEDDDLLVIFGLSYWHVDRKEIDVLLSKVPKKVRVISVNPRPSRQFEAVCCSLFKQYQSHISFNQLERFIK